MSANVEALQRQSRFTSHAKDNFSMPEGNEEEGMRFDILKAVAGDGTAARLGRLALPRREAVDTPNFFATTSRGVVPHLTPDTIAKYGSFPGVYMAMEDCECTYVLGVFEHDANMDCQWSKNRRRT